jgi:Peptidase family S41/N-terminal domain of Peptidase_S41 in eukaryotic IRBP
MDETELAEVIEQTQALVSDHYLFDGIAREISGLLARGLRENRYPLAEAALAEAVTKDLQSVNGDKHLRLVYHEEELAPRLPGDDAEEAAAFARWADRTCGGVACVRRLRGNVGYLDLQPVIFPVAQYAEVITAAMTVLATTDALVLDLRHCLGGDPAMVTFIISYLWDAEPVQLSGLRAKDGQLTQAWTLPYVPGRRFGKVKPVYVLTSGTTFSGGEQLSFDLRELGRATLVGERTRGGANARDGFVVHPHLEATIPVVEAVSPRSGGNWEGTGVAPHLEVPAGEARAAAYRLALRDVAGGAGPSAAEAQAELDSLGGA